MNNLIGNIDLINEKINNNKSLNNPLDKETIKEDIKIIEIGNEI